MRKLNYLYVYNALLKDNTKDEGKQMVQTVRIIKLAVDEKNGFIILRVLNMVIYFMY